MLMSLYPNLDRLNEKETSETKEEELVLRYITNKDLEEVKNATYNLFKEMNNQILDLKNKLEKLEKTTVKKKVQK